ncbi:uncharacterized protein F5891DRAFT_1195507 [Suillus fuscotomentosus]|uniref:Uncharacterized protein n=1 Tax=Suillus fuscotomentosus TaxID=1912939 RepID=A0AAD4HE30_9AGAM|nr:uncharacterized protein F5891DRAFT_1195507 [Suillus fuscotomentosus]KAG1894225.1 hypothetical protein F5891DRAFT_1195507 [Suillus fuscotomentosus]
MSIDEPSETFGSAQDVSIQSLVVAGDEAFQMQISMANVANDINSSSQAVGHLSSKKTELIRGLQKATNKFLHRHCKGGHPTTDLLRERIHAALESALLGMEVDDIMSKQHSKGAENLKTNDIQDLRTDNKFISPVAQQIWNSMKCRSFSPGTVPSMELEPLLICGQEGTLARMPGGYPTK